MDKRLCKQIFSIPHKEHMTDEDFSARAGFIHGVLIGSGFECKDYCQDILPFKQEFNPAWPKLYDRFIVAQPDIEWPVFGEKPNVVVFYNTMTNTSVDEPLSDWSWH